MALLVDVRAVAASRRPGFSKRQLAAGVADGRHRLPATCAASARRPTAGSPRARAAIADMRRIFEAHLATERGAAELDELAQLVEAGRPLCLLCFERHADHCHRRILGERLAERLGVEVVDLVP